ncbi:MAG: histone deacetylase family protein [Hyphomicrobiaceae bacterium]
MTTLLLTHSAFLEHDTGPGHPERPDRMRAVDAALSHAMFSGLVRDEARVREDFEDAVLRVHPRSYLDRLERARPRDGAHVARIDADTVMSVGSWEAAQRAVSAALDAVDAVVMRRHGEANVKNVFCQVRPPGHHAERTTAMGFCLFSSIAIAAKYAQARHGVERVAVVDFDVHHGNGTQDAFWGEPNLMFCSTHEMPLYPGTGSISERGDHDQIVNAPLRAGDAGDTFADAVRSRILPALADFSPDLILISAGFDAHHADPLANLRLTEADFGWITGELLEVAEKHAAGRVVSMLEGGYDLRGLAGSAAVHVRTLMGA